MPGGFHPFHAGHMALYNSARKAFPDADLYVAATNSQETRPFPFAVKEKLAKVAGVAPGHFVQVKSPFQAKEITQHYNPEEDVLIFVRSEKDKNESPKPGGMKKDGTPAYFQPYTGKDMQPFAKHAYFAYLPTVEFGPGITSATEIRNAWPKLNEKRKTAMVMSLYPATQKNPKLAANVVAMLDQVMGGEDINEGLSLHDVAWIGNIVPSFIQRVTSAGTREAKQTLQLGKILAKWTGTGELTPAEEEFAKQQMIDIAKMLASFAIASVPLGSSAAHAATGVAAGVEHLASHGAKDMALEALAVMLSKNFKFDFLKKIVHNLETTSGKTFSHVEKQQSQAQPDAVDQQVNQQFQKAKMGFGGMSESSADDPWGDQGRFAGDTPISLGGETAKQLQVGDIVTYLGQKARIEAMSKTGNTSRITIANKMGGITKDVLTRDLKRTGLSEENGGAGSGFGTGYPGTYEQENGPFTHKGGHRNISLTTESIDYLDEQ